MKAILILVCCIMIFYGCDNTKTKDLTKQKHNKLVGIIEDPKTFRDYIKNGYLYYNVEKDNNTAMYYLNLASSMEPTNWVSYSLRGEIKLKLEDYRGAILDLDKAIKFKPGEITAFNVGEYSFVPPNEYENRGIAKFKLADYKGAISDLNKVLDDFFGSENCQCLYYRGLAKIKLGQKDSGCLDLSNSGEKGCSFAYDAIKTYCNN